MQAPDERVSLFTREIENITKYFVQLHIHTYIQNLLHKYLRIIHLHILILLHIQKPEMNPDPKFYISFIRLQRT